MTNGWIKVHRGLLEHGIFGDSDLLRVWLYCLLRASYRAMAVPSGRQTVQLQPGQLLYGRKAVSQRLGISEGKLRHIMEQLAEFGSLKLESTNRYSVVTITNWQSYQQEMEKSAFPFDCDFLDAEEAVQENGCHTADHLQPADSQANMQSAGKLADGELM